MGQHSEEINFILLFVTGTLGLLFLAAVLVLFVFINKKRLLIERTKLQELKSSYQQSMLKAAIDAQEKERKRIAENLHDEVGALLSLARLNANKVFGDSTSDNNHKTITKDTIELIDDTIRNVRRISKDLLPATLDEFGLIQSVEDLVSKVNASTNDLQVHFEHHGEFYNLYPEIELALFRVIQELINNVIKHAQATAIKIKLILEDHLLKLDVIDDGVGFKFDNFGEKSAFEKGIGLKNIHSRISMLDGDIHYLSNAPTGTRVLIEIKI